MSEKMHPCNPKTRHDFFLYVSVTNSNINGDPDTAGSPRVDYDGHGLMSGECQKRWVRDGAEENGHPLFIKAKTLLQETQRRVREIALGDNFKEGAFSWDKAKAEEQQAIVTEMLKMFDCRLFGYVAASKTDPAGQHTGPFVINDGVTLDPVRIEERNLTRIVSTKSDTDKDRTNMGTFAERPVIQYGLYRSHGCFVTNHAVGISPEDMAEFYQYWFHGPANKTSTARRGASKASVALYVFSHDHKLGNAPWWKLRDVVQVTKRKDVEFPRDINDYLIEVNHEAVPKGVKMTVLDHSNINDPASW